MKLNHLSRREADRLITREYDRIRRRAIRFARARRNLDADEIESVAMAGLIRAAENFDPTRATFSSYASAVVDDYMRKSANKQWKHLNRLDDGAAAAAGADAEPDQEWQAKCPSALVQDDHADLVIDNIDNPIALDEWLDQLNDPRHQEALLRRLRGDRVQDIADHFEVHETTVRRWLWGAGNMRRESISQESD